MAVSLTSLVVSVFNASQAAKEEGEIFTAAQSTATSVIFTQRETLAFTTKYSLWLGGATSKRDAQISRALLGQRLAVITDDGVTMGEKSTPEFIYVLKTMDSILDNAPDGFLSDAASTKFQAISSDVINQMLLESRKMVVSYQQALDKDLLVAVTQREDKAKENLIYLLVLIFFTSIFLVSFTLGFRRQYNTAARNLEQGLIELQGAELALSEAQLRVQLLEDTNQAKDDFISTINHELRTPLTSIIGYIDLLQNSNISAKSTKTYLEVIEKNSAVLLDLVDGILSLTKLETQDFETTNTSVDLYRLIQNKFFVLTPLAEERNIELKIIHDSSIDYVVGGNSGQLSQVFLNLISNAIKFSDGPGKVEVSLSRIQGQNGAPEVKVTVQDFGIGIPIQDQSQLFTRFFRASNVVDSQIQGTGLGLSIISRIIELHHGSVSVESELGKGSTFTVTLPAYESPVYRMILEKRSGVLSRAITAIEGASDENLYITCHEMAGAVGFYSFEKLGKEIESFMKWLKANPEAGEQAILKRKNDLLHVLKLDSMFIIETEES